MEMGRREFIGLAGSACLAGGCAVRQAAQPASPATQPQADDWQAVRALFDQDPAYSNLTGFLLMPHPRPVREALAAYRDALDRNPARVLEEQFGLASAGKESLVTAPRTAAARFIAVDPDDIALTDSTTMGLGLVYGGFRAGPGEEIVTSSHGHFSTLEALRLRATRDGVAVRIVDLYADPAQVSVDEVVGKLRAAVTPQTRLVAITWVHSSTGVKMPVRAMADALAEVNAERAPEDRVLLSVDGVHGFGIDAVTMSDLGCDIFIAGCHKWLCGPRGTGIVWARPEAWRRITSTIPAFEADPFGAFLRGELPTGYRGPMNTPGGFHSFEHRWALPEAFALQAQIGRERIQGRIAALSTRLKDGLRELPKLRLHTPLDPALSAGINCFEVEGMTPPQVVHALIEKKIIASDSPYRVSYARLAPSLLNDEAEVDAAVAAVAAL